MEKKVLLNDLVGRGTHIRTEVTPKVVIADGSHPKGEIWDANKVVSAISQDNQLDESKFQAKLVSGTNIKTINNNSVLGSGNINITSVVFGYYVNGKFYREQPQAINSGMSVYQQQSVEHYNQTIEIHGYTDTLYIDRLSYEIYMYKESLSQPYVKLSANDHKVTQIATADNLDYPVLFSSKSGDAGVSNDGNVHKDNGLKYNPVTKNLQVTKINGVSADLTNYYTKSEVEALIAAALNPNSETPQEPVEQPGE